MTEERQKHRDRMAARRKEQTERTGTPLWKIGRIAANSHGREKWAISPADLVHQRKFATKRISVRERDRRAAATSTTNSEE